MPDPTNEADIFGLLFLLRDRPRHSRHHAALKALVAERNALKQRVAELESHKSISVRLLIEERNALRERVAELESQNPSDREVLDASMMNREAELRVICSALAGIYSNPNRVHDPVVNGKTAAAAAKAALDALAELRPREWRTSDPVRDLCGDRDSDLDGEALAAMRKGATDGK